MRIGKVVGHAVSTVKQPAFTGKTLLLVAPLAPDGLSNDVIVAVDSIGAGRGEIVLVVTGGAAARTPQTEGVPVDATVVAIVDQLKSDTWLNYSSEGEQ